MKEENIRLLVAAALGALSGLFLGMLIWGDEERKGKFSSLLSSLSDISKELEDLDTKEAKDLKEKISNILSNVQEILDGKDG